MIVLVSSLVLETYDFNKICYFLTLPCDVEAGQTHSPLKDYLTVLQAPNIVNPTAAQIGRGSS